MIRRLHRSLRRIARDRRGVTVTEFAIVCPVMLVLVMGLGDIAYQGYVQAVLVGALQKAARDATIQGNNTSSATGSLDQQVENAVLKVAANASFQVSRKSYAQFSNIAPEVFIDTPSGQYHDGIYDNNECFYDVNGNGVWDADPGVAGQGGADDVVLYTMTVSYPRLFPVAALIGMSGTAQLSASATLKNQPYATQTANPVTKICPGS